MIGASKRHRRAWIFFLLAAVCLMVGVCLAPQWSAWHLGYAAWLGQPWVVWSRRVYSPAQYVRWVWQAGNVYPWAFYESRWLLTGGGIGMVICIVTGQWLRLKRPPVQTFGSSRWATLREIRRMGLLQPEGLLLGQVYFWRRWRYLRHGGRQHVLVFAPTTMGKTTGLVIPTLLSLHHSSVIIHDIKGENWQYTAGYRARFSRVLYYNPTSPESIRHNPLMEIRLGANEVRDTQNITDILVDPEGKNDDRDHWERGAEALIAAGILHVLYAEDDKTLAGVANLYTDPQRTLLDTFHAMLNTHHLGDQVHPFVASVAREFLNKAPNDRSGIVSSALDFLGLYRDPLIARTTSTCDFRLADLCYGPEPISLYLVVPPSDLSRTKPLVRLMLNQIGRLLTEQFDGPQRRSIDLILDEFTALGHLEFFESELAYMASYGIRAMLIVQSLNQLDGTYGLHNAIMDNCHIRVAFTANDDRTASRISHLLGSSTEVRQTQGYSGNRFSMVYRQRSTSEGAVARPLLTEGEIMQLPMTREIILVAGQPPIMAEKLTGAYRDGTLQYRERWLQDRLLPPPVLMPAPAKTEQRKLARWSAEDTKPEDVEDVSERIDKDREVRQREGRRYVL